MLPPAPKSLASVPTSGADEGVIDGSGKKRRGYTSSSEESEQTEGGEHHRSLWEEAALVKAEKERERENAMMDEESYESEESEGVDHMETIEE
jgi:hypothetical protein